MAFPVLLIGFNRPELITRVLNELKVAPVPELYVWLDGPRESVVSDRQACRETRLAVENCGIGAKLFTKFNDSNLGCRQSVSRAISWFFSQVPAGIVLEDDCLPSQDFFWFMNLMLEKYEGNNEVLSVSGYMRFKDWSRNPASFHFSRYPNIWGWGSWSRVMETYDPNISEWGSLRKTNWLRNDVGLSRDAARFWRYKFDEVWRGEEDTWDYQLTFLSFRRGLKNIQPHRNLIKNLGIGQSATHTKRESRFALVEEFDDLEEIISPETTTVDSNQDRRTELEIFRTKRPPGELMKIGLRKVFKSRKNRAERFPF